MYSLSRNWLSWKLLEILYGFVVQIAARETVINFFSKELEYKYLNLDF